MTEITVNRVTQKDLETLRYILGQEAKHYGHAYHDGDLRHPNQESQLIVAASVVDNSAVCGWIARVNRMPAGVITTQVGLSGGVFVIDAYQRMGVGSALNIVREDHYRSLGYKHMMVHVLPDNDGSIAMHKRLGFVFREASLNNGGLEKLPPHIPIIMHKALEPL